MKLSVIIPHKNDVNNLKKLIGSINFSGDYEIVIIDDNSEKNNFRVISEYFKHNEVVKVIKSSENGAGAARNEGIKYSNGRWIIFADSDDLFAENLNSTIDKYLDSDYDCIYFKPLLNLNRKNDYRRFYDILCKEYIERPNLKNEWNLRLNFDVPWSKMIKKEVIIKNDIKFDNTKKQNDTIFNQKIGIYSKKIRISNENIYIVNDRQDSISYQNNKDFYDDIVDVQIRSFLLKTRSVKDKKLLKFDCNLYFNPLFTVIKSFVLYRDSQYSIKIYKKFNMNKVPVFTPKNIYIMFLRKVNFFIKTRT